MNDSSHSNGVQDKVVGVRGELTYRLGWAPIRVIAILTGFFLVRGILELVARFCLGLRRKVVITTKYSCVIMDVEWSMLGREIRKTTTQAPIEEIRAVRFENRQNYLYLLVGFGSLAIGTWIGIQWFADGLRAGYPYLALVGAGVVLAGIVVDLGLYFLIPRGKGRSRLIVAMGPWKMRLAGVDKQEALKFLDAIRSCWEGKAVKR